MRALFVNEIDGPFVLREIARPEPARGQVLVHIAASGVNPLDTKIRAGRAPHARQPLAAVLGVDLAGVVEAVGDGVDALRPDDEVYGLATGVGGHQGSLAEYAAVDAALVARKPARLSMREAAALPLVLITAWEGLVDRAGVATGMKVLIQGGADGVGHIAVQLARAFGAEVCASDSAGRRAIIEELGATFIDRESPMPEVLAQHTHAGFDIVFNTVGGASLDAAFQSVRTYTGHVVSSLGWGRHALAPLSFRGATYSGVFTLLPLLTGTGREHHGEILAEGARLVDAGRLRVRVDPRRFTLADAEEAHRVVAGGTGLGKVVVEISNVR